MYNTGCQNEFNSLSKGLGGHPPALREKYGLKPGTNVQVVDYGGVLVLVLTYPAPITAGAGLLKGDDSLTEAIVAEHRRKFERE